MTLTLLRAPPLPPLATAASQPASWGGRCWLRAASRTLEARPPQRSAEARALSGTAAPHRRVTAGSRRPPPSPTSHPPPQPRASAAESVEALAARLEPPEPVLWRAGGEAWTEYVEHGPYEILKVVQRTSKG